MNAIEQIKAELKGKQIIVISENDGIANIKWDCRSLDDVKALLASAQSFIADKQVEELRGIGSGPDYNTTEGRFRNAHKFQQEQPKLPGYDKALLEVKSKVDKLYDEAGIGTCEYDSGFYNGIIETCMKLRGFIKTRLDSDEQPEVNSENNGWIDCRKQMPKETKRWSDTLQGHREWTESEPVLAWDSVYGCRVDATKNGKWMSEQKGGYTGQTVHSIIAWRPIPEFFV